MSAEVWVLFLIGVPGADAGHPLPVIAHTSEETCVQHLKDMVPGVREISIPIPGNQSATYIGARGKIAWCERVPMADDASVTTQP